MTVPRSKARIRLVLLPALLVLGAALALSAPAAAEITSPLPGGKYKGETKRDRRVVIEVANESANGTIKGKFRMPCADVAKRFRIEDPEGGFKVKRKTRRGKTLLRVGGSFTDLETVKGEVRKVRSDKRRCQPARFEAMLKGHEQIEQATVRYGPYDVEPSEGGHGGGGQMNFVDRIDKPCEDCFIVGMDPDLVHEDGSSANHATNAMLHHTVLGNMSDRDATCTSRPERFFASGNERTEFLLPQGYGYRVEPGDSWRTLTDLMNMGDAMQRLSIEIEFYFVRAPADLEPVRPMWLDIDNCGNSEYSIPAGRSDTHWDFEVTPELEGGIVAIGGHVHNDGVRIEATNATRSESICNSVAGYGTIEAFMGNIESMTGCVGEPVASIDAGDVLRLHSIYDSPREQDDVMGIMLAYVHPEPVP